MISRLTQIALTTLGQLIQVARRERGFSQAALAERLRVTRHTVMAIEKGDAVVAIGTVFEAAYILGIPLFAENKAQLSQWQAALTGFSALLPLRSRQKKYWVSDDF